MPKQKPSDELVPLILEFEEEISGRLIFVDQHWGRHAFVWSAKARGWSLHFDTTLSGLTPKHVWHYPDEWPLLLVQNPLHSVDTPLIRGFASWFTTNCYSKVRA